MSACCSHSISVNCPCCNLQRGSLTTQIQHAIPALVSLNSLFRCVLRPCFSECKGSNPRNKNRTITGTLLMSLDVNTDELQRWRTKSSQQHETMWLKSNCKNKVRQTNAKLNQAKASCDYNSSIDSHSTILLPQIPSLFVCLFVCFLFCFLFYLGRSRYEDLYVGNGGTTVYTHFRSSCQEENHSLIIILTPCYLVCGR